MPLLQNIIILWISNIGGWYFLLDGLVHYSMYNGDFISHLYNYILNLKNYIFYNLFIYLYVYGFSVQW